jgi:signal recognition particle subunit SRP54
VASRILGMGDLLGLIEKAESNLDRENAQKAAEKLVTGNFTLEDFLSQLKEVRKMGPIGQLLGMIPGMSGPKMQIDEQDAERQMKRTEAIIHSMTIRERRNPDVLNGSRKRRIAAGSGTTVYEVNQLVKQFKDMQKMMKQLGGRRGMPGMPRMR